MRLIAFTTRPPCSSSFEAGQEAPSALSLAEGSSPTGLQEVNNSSNVAVIMFFIGRVSDSFLQYITSL